MSNSGTLEFSKESLAEQLVNSDATQDLLDKYSSALNHLTEFCWAFEGRFDFDPSVISYEELGQYKNSAKFLRSTGRKFSRIYEVAEEMLKRETL